MIEIPRSLARQFRAVLRRCLAAQESRGPWPLVLCQADRHGLTLRARRGDVAVCCRLPGARPDGALAFRASVLAEFEGSAPGPVILESAAPGEGRARWDEGGERKELELEAATTDSVPPLPALPEQFTDLPDTFLAALQEASVTAAKASARFGVARVQLRGRRGEVVGTDGRQLLVWGGFRLPWKEDVLIPRLPVFGHRDTPFTGPVAVGRTEKDVALRVGPWTFVLAIDATNRYPQVERVIPAEAGVTSRLRLDPADAALLRQALPRLPGREDEHSPVTLELGPAVAVRARPGDGPATEIPLPRSAASGRPVRLRTDRAYLRRAAQLGFTELWVTAPNQPVCCRDGARLYLWVPLTPPAPIPPPPAAVPPAAPAPAAAAARREPPEDPQPEPTHRTQRRKPMPVPSTDGHAPRDEDRPDGQPAGGFADLLSEAEALRAALHDALGRSARLVAALKQQRRQAKAVEAAMATLRQLQLGR
jgi:hypothetical protein